MFSWQSFDSLSSRLTLALAHFLWQGAALWLLVRLAENLLPIRSARGRYLIQVGGLLFMAVAVPVTMAVVPRSDWHSSSDPSGVGRAVPIPGVVPYESPVGESVAGTPAFAATTSSDLSPVEGDEAATAVRDENQDKVRATFDLRRFLRRMTPWIVVGYLFGVITLLLRLIGGTWSGDRFRKSADPVTDAALLAAVAAESQRLGLRAAPMVAWCHRIASPVVVGIFRPVILLPLTASTGLTSSQLQALIAHEVAHIARYDLVVNLVQRLVESILFFHPAVWMLSRRITRQRELACDELVVNAGWDRLSYADALLRMAEISVAITPPRSLSVAGLAASGSSTSDFKRRVLAILQQPTGFQAQPGRWTVLGIVLVLMTAVSIPLLGERWTLWAHDPLTLAADKEPPIGDSKSPADVADLPPATTGSDAEVPEYAPVARTMTLRTGEGRLLIPHRVDLAQIGYPTRPLPRWYSVADRDGVVSLAKLPQGIEWVVADPPRIVAQVPQPKEAAPVQRTIPPTAGLPNTNLSVRAELMTDDLKQETIRVFIENQTGAEIRFSAADLCLECGGLPVETCYGLSPEWHSTEAGRFPQTLVNHGDTGEIRINWRDWVRQGIWYRIQSPEIITGPVLPVPEPGQISIRVRFATHGALPIAATAPQLLAQADEPDVNSPKFAALPSQAEPVEAPTDELKQQLFQQYILRGGKIPSSDLAAAITLIASRGAFDSTFIQQLLTEFDRVAPRESKNQIVRQKLLEILIQVCALHGNQRWLMEWQKQHPNEPVQQVIRNTDEMDQKILAALTKYGYTADRSDIDQFTLAIRNLHDPAGKEFLANVLQNDLLAKKSPPVEPPAVTRQGKRNVAAPRTPAAHPDAKWEDNTGGNWTDASYIAAVGLAELGDDAGFEWLLHYAGPNRFGIDMSLWRHPHFRDSRGSLRDSSREALIDLLELPPDSTAEQINAVWDKHPEPLHPQRVLLKFDR